MRDCFNALLAKNDDVICKIGTSYENPGAHPREPKGFHSEPLPLEPKNIKFSRFLQLTYVNCNLQECVLKPFAVYEDRGSL